MSSLPYAHKDPRFIFEKRKGTILGILESRFFSLCFERWDNDGLVNPWSVLYLLYFKQDQKILKFDMSIGMDGKSFIQCLVNTAIFYLPVGRRARQ